MGITSKARGLLRIKAEAIAIAVAVGFASAAAIDEFIRWFWVP